MRRMTDIQHILEQTATTGAPAGDINSTSARPEPMTEWPDAGQDLPEQMGGTRTTLMPGVDTFQLPANLSQLWHTIEAEDKRPYLANGQPNPSKGQKFQRRQLKFDRNNPLVVVGGKHDGDVMTASFSTHPRPRGKADDAKTPWISDAAYMLDVSLGDRTRPSDPKVLEATINRYAGKTIRLEHGLTAQCRPDKVRYIRVATAEGETDLADPQGVKGCGRRYYTSDFKNTSGGYDKEIACDCSVAPSAASPAGVTVVVRAFESVERFLPPLGAK